MRTLLILLPLLLLVAAVPVSATELSDENPKGSMQVIASVVGGDSPTVTPTPSVTPSVSPTPTAQPSNTPNPSVKPTSGPASTTPATNAKTGDSSRIGFLTGLFSGAAVLLLLLLFVLKRRRKEAAEHHIF